MDVEPEIEAAQDGKTREIVMDNVDSEPLGIRREDTSDRLAIFKAEKEELEASLAREQIQALQLKQEVAEAETRNAKLTKASFNIPFLSKKNLLCACLRSKVFSHALRYWMYRDMFLKSIKS